MAGYIGYSRSVGAALAEEDGKLPLSRAIPAVARAANCTHERARAALLAVGPCEWHHTSKKFNRTDFYDVSAAARRVSASKAIVALEAIGFRARLASTLRSDLPLDERLARRERVAAELALEAATTPDVVISAYHNDWTEEHDDGT